MSDHCTENCDRLSELVRDQHAKCAGCQARVEGRLVVLEEMVDEIHEVVYRNGLVADLRSIQLAMKVVGWVVAIFVVPTCLVVVRYVLEH